MVKCRQLSPEFLTENIAAFIAISADMSPWTEKHFLAELPDKWELSFAFWDGDIPTGYCIMSRREENVHIHQFMVATDRRGEGIGAMMIGSSLGARSVKAQG